MVAVNFLRLAALMFVCASSAGAFTLQLHEARKGVPARFSLHGAASPDTMLNLRMALRQNDFPGLEKQLYDVSTPSSANYGKHLSKAEVEHYVAPTQESVVAVNAWLAANGLSGTPISPAGDWIAVQVPVSKANKLLGAQFSVFNNDATGGQEVRTLSYSIPAELKDHLDLVHPTVTFSDIQPLQPIVSPSVQLRPQADNLASLPNAVPASCNALVDNKTAIVITPACLQALYGITTTPATQPSNKLGVSGFIGQFANQADLRAFLMTLRPDMSPDTTFDLQTLDGGQNSQDPAVAGVEANLDIQYTVGVATGVPTTFISVGNATTDGVFGFLDIINFLINQAAPPQVLTTSYGANEDPMSSMLAQNLCNAYAQLGARGTSILFASGDGGVAGAQEGTICKAFIPTFPSGCPYLTSVGATSLPASGIETAAPFSSGGFSNIFPTPQYQQASVDAYLEKLGNLNKGLFNKSGRAYPDVSAQGVNFAVAVSNAFNLVSGTSASSPTFASIIALLNDGLNATGRPPLGFLNPWLYSTGASALNDITAGSNPGCISTTGFPAEPGWDPVTGLGTPNFPKLLASLGL